MRMEDEIILDTLIVHLSVGGHELQIWPLSWVFIAVLTATLLIGVLALAVIVFYTARRNHDSKPR
jgi:hypothetical protein